MHNSPTSPGLRVVMPPSRLNIRQSTSGKGKPIEPVRISPYNGLQWVAVGASDNPYPSTSFPPVNASNFSLVSRMSGADPEIQPLIELRLYFPAMTSGLLWMAVYWVGTPGNMDALYFWMLERTSAMSLGLGIMTIDAPERTANNIPATIPYTWKRGMAMRTVSFPSTAQ